MATPAPVIRLARSEEAPVLRAIVHAAYAHYVARIGRPPMPMVDDYEVRVAHNQAWVMEDAGVVIGVLVLEDRPNSLLLDNIAVRPDRQHGGYGRRLIAFAETEARRRGHPAIDLYTNVLMTENIALYLRLGFQETGRATGMGFERVNMTKTLT